MVSIETAIPRWLANIRSDVIDAAFFNWITLILLRTFFVVYYPGNKLAKVNVPESESPSYSFLAWSAAGQRGRSRGGAGWLSSQAVGRFA